MKKKLSWKTAVWLIVVISLAFSIIYSIVKIINAPSGAVVPDDKGHLRSDYVLMLLQCALGLVVIGLPMFIERKWSFEIPNYMSILYFVFLYCAIYLGEVKNFYYVVPHWDSVLHAFSGAMLGALGFTLVSILNDSKNVSVDLSPAFVAMFAFCFALSVGAIWEIYEFSGDSLFGLNMQKFRLADGTELVGHAALVDTMKDIIVDAVSAFAVAVIGYLQLVGKTFIKKKKK